jgi:hypothetical protein
MVLSKTAKKNLFRGALRLGSLCSFSPVKREVTGTFQSPDKVSPMITETEGKTTYQHCERIT